MVVEMKIISGGGIQSNKFSTTRAGKQEPISRSVNPAGVSQAGVSTAFKKEPMIRGKGYSAPTGVTDPCKIGPGAGRQIYKSGSQQRAPTVGPMEPTRDTLREYGPESKK